MKRRARQLGIWLQGLTLGFLLFIAIVQLLALSSGARLFDYQGF